MLTIARALFRELKLLLLEEPYEGLAPAVRHVMEKVLLEVNKSRLTTVIVEQYAVAALKLADSAVMVDTDEVAFLGTTEELLNDEALRHVYVMI